MICFLTGSPFEVGGPGLNPENGFIRRLRAALPDSCGALFVCSDPASHAFTDHIAGDMRRALEAAGIALTAFRVLDGRNEKDAAARVAQAELIVLAGGHVPTQNAFFQRIGLGELLKGRPGVLIGISAGSMNGAKEVYAQPERESEAVSPAYRRFLPGLGLTKTQLLPHYQLVKNSRVDGLRLFEDITFPDSMGRRFIAIPDGSYLLIRDGTETLYGEAWLIENGAMRQIAGPDGVTALC